MQTFRRGPGTRLAARCLLAFLLAAPVLTLGAPGAVEAGTKKYYLTRNSFQGNAVLTACDRGFHMASLWEIFSLTNLKYDSTRGQIRADSGSGPAAELFGWIRTGVAPSTSGTPGIGNCGAWTSNSAAHYGTIVELNGHWTDPAQDTHPWGAGTASCDSTVLVWCVQN